MKKELRKKYKNLRNELEDKTFLSGCIKNIFLSSAQYQECESVLLYYATGSEVLTNEIFKACIADSKTVAFPVCLDDNGAMDFFKVNGETDLEQGMYGIKSPKSSCERFVPDEKSLCVVPGLTFDLSGYRLGYGKGYYDRYLSEFPGISCGLCYEALVETKLPVNSYDKHVDYLITDKKIYKFNSKEDLKNG